MQKLFLKGAKNSSVHFMSIIAAAVLLASNGFGFISAHIAQAGAQQFTQPCGNAGAPGVVHHVIWIWMENESYSKVIGNTSQAPYQNQLANQCGIPTNMYNESHGSLVNYVTATNGQSITTDSQFTTHNDCSPNTTFCYSNEQSIFGQINSTPGESWRGYAEDMPSNCYPANTGNYAVRHNPAAYYPALASSCGQFDVPMGSISTKTGNFYTDVQNGTLPSFSFITPNLIDDAHDSNTLTGDTWLSQLIPTITNGANYQSGDTAIFITNDEGGSGTSDHVIGEDCANQTLAPSQPSCHIPTIVVAPYIHSGTQDGTFYTHYSMLRTTEELLGLPLLGLAASANSMTANFNLGSGGSQPPTLQPVTNLTATATGTTTIGLSWTASALATSYTVLRNGTQVGTTSGTTFSDTGLTPGTTYSYQVVAQDGSGNTAPSATVSATTQAGATQQWVGNQSFETDLTGWAGLYNSASKSSRVAGGYDGSYSLRSINNSTATGANGFIDKPHWIDGTSGKVTVAGTVYSGSVWVKADTVGQKISLFIREFNSAGTVVNQPPYNVSVTATAADTNWFKITENYPAVATGDSLGFYVYSSNSAAGKGFNADLVSLTSPTGQPDTTPPTTPTNLTATPVGQTQVNLSWAAATDNVGVTGYTILENGTQVGTAAANATSFSVSGLTAATNYTFSVVANDAAGNASPAATVSATTPPVLGTVTNLQATTPSSSEADLTWSAATGATSYTVQRNGIGINTITGTSYNDTGLNPGIAYTYTIVASDDYEDTTTSTPLQVTTPSNGAASTQPLALCGNQNTAATPIKHVIVVMLENRSYKTVVGSSNAPYQTSLTSQCGVGTAMFGATHTSAANYLALSAGEFPATSPAGCGRVSSCTDASANLYSQLDAAGLNWKGYVESMPSACYQSSIGSYKIGHNPILFYSNLGSECQTNDVAVPDLTAQSGQFWTDLQNRTLPSFSWVTPNLDHDGEGSGTSAQNLLAADTWLQNFIGLVQQSNSYQDGNTAVLITYDEGTGADSVTGEDCTNQSLDMPVTNGVSAHQDSCHVPFFVVYPYTAAGTQDGTFFDHYSVTKTVEDIFGLSYLAHAGDSQTNSLIGHFGLQAQQ